MPSPYNIIFGRDTALPSPRYHLARTTGIDIISFSTDSQQSTINYLTLLNVSSFPVNRLINICKTVRLPILILELTPIPDCKLTST